MQHIIKGAGQSADFRAGVVKTILHTSLTLCRDGSTDQNPGCPAEPEVLM